MQKKILSLALACAMGVSAFGGLPATAADVLADDFNPADYGGRLYPFQSG